MYSKTSSYSEARRSSLAKARPVTSGEVAATIFRGLGLDIHHDLPGPQNRPIPLVEYSLSSIKELF